MRLLVHIGYPKAGSSTLQEAVLSRHSDVHYLAGIKLKAALDTAQVQHAFSLYRTLIGTSHRSRADLVDIWQNCYVPIADTKRLNVLSSELFVERSGTAADLKAIVGRDAAILVVVREQIDLLRSRYDMSPFVADDPARRFVRFDKWLETTLSREATIPFVRSLRFVEVIGAYAAAFGAANVHVISTGRLFSDETAISELCGKLGVDGEVFRSLAMGRHLGEASNHSYKKVTRRLLGSKTPNAYLPKPLIPVAKWILRRAVPARRTVAAANDVALVDKFFVGNKIADLEQMNLGALLI